MSDAAASCIGECFAHQAGGTKLPVQIDHIVIGVRDLASASANYARAGFTVTAGGAHVGGLTHNALVSFEDGAYFELIAFTDFDNPASQTHRWWRQIAAGEGLVDFAVLSPDVAAEAAALAERGVAIDGPSDGGRVRPDGQRVAWRTLHVDLPGAPLPFIIDDQTPRNLRVPDGAATRHPGGFTGVAGLAIAVADLDGARDSYALLTGSAGSEAAPTVPGGIAAWRFETGPHWIELVKPGDGPSALADHLKAHGEGPVEVSLRAAGAGEGRYLPFDTTNGVRIRVVG
jgi:hypothetical protein